MDSITTSEAIRSACPDLRLGLIQFDAVVEPSSPELLKLISEQSGEYEEGWTTASMRERPLIAATRRAYKALGKDPSRYRPSAEALCKRLIQGKGLYQVNNVVDLLNLLSVQSGYSIGSYDLTKVEGAVSLDRGGDQPYEGIGRGDLNIEALPVLFDQKGPFGSPTSDSQRTMIDVSSRQIAWVVFDFEGSDELNKFLEKSQHLLEQYCAAKVASVQLL
jgi:DNA/RNA-binding domain of Phe-tRNA-synthetase-like protein